MGEAYRGLTIRFGAETSNLKKAIAAVNSSLKTTESMARMVQQGLKFDPTSLTLMGQKAVQTSVKIGELDEKIRLLGREERELSNVQGVTFLAKHIDDAAQRAAAAKARMNELNAEIAALKNHVKQLAAENNVAFDPKNVYSTLTALKAVGVNVDDLEKNYRELRIARDAAFDDNETYKEVLALQKNRIEQERYRAELKKTAEQLVEYNAQTRLVGTNSAAYKEVESRISNVRAALAAVNTQVDVYGNVMKAAGDSTEAAEKHAKALEEQERLTRLEADLLVEAMEVLASQGFTRPTQGMEELIAEEREAISLASDLLIKQERYSTQIAKLEGDIRELEELEANGNRKAAASIRQKEEELERVHGKLEGVESELEQVNGKLDKIRGDRAFEGLDLDAEKARARLQSLMAGLDGVGAKASTTNSKLKNLGITLQMSIAPALYQAGYRSIEAADKIDSAFRDMKKTVDGTDTQFQNLRDAAIEFSQTHVTSADTILEIEAMGGQLGIAVGELEEFAKVASDLDIATDINAEDVAKQLGQLHNVMGWVDGDMERYANSLVRLGNNMPAQESAIANITTRIASMGTIVGMSTPEVLAWSTALASTGQGAEAAGTALSRTMADIEKAVGSGGDSLELFAKTAGMSASDFKSAWEGGNVTDVMKKLIEGLNDMEDSGESATNQLDELGMSGVRQMMAIEGLMNTIGVLDDALKMSGDAWNGVSDKWGKAGDAAREAAQKSEGFSGSLQELKNAASGVGDALGAGMVTYIDLAKTALIAFGDAFKLLPGPIQTALVGITGFIAVSGSLLTVWSTASEVFGGASKTIKVAETAAGEFAVTTQKAGAAAGTFGGRIKELLSPTNLLKGAMVGLAVGGIALVASTFADYVKKQEDVKQATTGLTQGMSAIGAASSKASADINAAFSKEAFDLSGVDALIEKQGKLAATIKDRNENVSYSASLIQSFGEKMAEFNGVTDNTSDAYAQLKIAVDEFNQEAGTNLQVMQNESGAYVVMKDNVEMTKDSIYALIDAMKAKAVAEVAAENYKDLFKQEAEDSKALTAAIQAQTDARDAYTQALETHDEALIASAQGAMAEAERKVGELTKAHDASAQALARSSEQMTLANEAIEENADGITTWLASNTQMQGALANNNVNMVDFRNTLRDVGVDEKRLGELGIDAMNDLARAYKGNYKSIADVLDKYEVDVDHSKTAYVKATDAQTKAAKDLAKDEEAAMKVANDAVESHAKVSEEAKDRTSQALTFMAMKSGQSMDAVANDFRLAGYSIDDFAELSDDDMKNVAQSYDGGAKSIASAMGDIASTTDSKASAAAQAMHQIDDSHLPTGTWADHLSANFNGSIDFSGAIAKAAEAASKIAGLLGHTIPKEGPLRNGGRGEKEWGLHMAQNFADGMKAGLPLIERQAETMASVLEGSMSSSDYAKRAEYYGRQAVNAMYGATANINVTASNALTKADLYEVITAATSNGDGNVELVLKLNDREFGRAVSKVS